ncbi:MAG: hypothetical protein KBD85_00730 [Elusimicrobia bacterium]|nr:hypothetical protein [Elusimicrobiota bacterium]MBP9698519.1 hypothetical protein [Elusimicrobiota bacterium]
MIKKWLSLAVTTAFVLFTHQQTWAADPAATDAFWNTAATDKPVAKPAATAPKPAGPPAVREPKPSVSAELIERLNSLEKKVAELSAPKEAAPAASGWTSGYKDGGGGFFWASPDQAFVFKTMGYVQFHHIWQDGRAAAIRTNSVNPVSNDFFIRRARLDFSGTVNKKTELFVEIEGGVATTPASGNTASTTQSDFALVEAKITHKFVDPFQLRFGKFLTPFSNENSFRGSRALDTVERYAALNTMILLPSLDTQTGAMTFGQWAKGRYAYYAGVFNGNGRQGDNFRDNNSQKNLQGRFAWKPLAAKTGPLSAMSFGLGVDWDRELAQTLDLRTLGGSRMYTLNVQGDRMGFSPDVFVPVGKWLEIRGEALMERFNDSRTDLYGGFGQIMWNVFKTEKGLGFSPLVRAESAVISESVNETVARLNILTLGWNFYFNKNVRWQCNYLPSHFRYTGDAAAVALKEGHYDEILNQLQVKF